MTAVSATAYFISDIHLRGKDDPRLTVLIGFLNGLRAQLQSQSSSIEIIFLGDVFDLWLGDKEVFKTKYQKLLEVLIQLKKAGVKFRYFEGNHDLYLKEFWEQKLEFMIAPGPQTLMIGNLTAYLEHGDEINRSDFGYLFLRWFLRTPVLSWLIRTLPGAWIETLGKFSSQSSRRWTHRESSQEWELQIHKLLLEHVRSLSMSENFDFHISGHSHFRSDDRIQANGKEIRVINLGCWPGADRYRRDSHQPQVFWINSNAESGWLALS